MIHREGQRWKRYVSLLPKLLHRLKIFFVLKEKKKKHYTKLEEKKKVEEEDDVGVLIIRGTKLKGKKINKRKQNKP